MEQSEILMEMYADLRSLRSDLNALKSEIERRLSALEEGVQSSFPRRVSLIAATVSVLGGLLPFFRVLVKSSL